MYIPVADLIWYNIDSSCILINALSLTTFISDIV